MQWSEIQPFMGGTDPFHTVHSDRVAVTVTRVDPGQPDPFQPGRSSERLGGFVGWCDERYDRNAQCGVCCRHPYKRGTGLRSM